MKGTDRNRLGRLPRWRLWIGILTLLAGALVLLTPLASWGWDEWQQRMMVADFEANRAPPADPPAEVSVEGPSPIVGPAQPEGPGQANQGEPLPIRLEIPTLDLSYMVMPGIEDDQLRLGPGHYPQTALPGAGSNAAFAGHRTIKGHPAYFYHLDRLREGDPIRVILPDRQLTYRVERVYLTSPYDISVLDATAGETLTLTTCDPPGLDDRRLIVRARLQA